MLEKRMKTQWDYSNNFIGLDTKIELKGHLLRVKRVLSQDRGFNATDDWETGAIPKPGKWSFT